MNEDYEWDSEVKSVLHPTEPANFPSSYMIASKGIVDQEIGVS